MHGVLGQWPKLAASSQRRRELSAHSTSFPAGSYQLRQLGEAVVCQHAASSSCRDCNRSGASTLVMRDRTDATMDKGSLVTAPARFLLLCLSSLRRMPKQTRRSAAGNPAASSAAANAPSDVVQDLRKEKAEAAPRQRLERQSVAASPPPPPPVAAACAVARIAADEARCCKDRECFCDSSKRGFSAPMHDAVVTTGVAAASH